MICSGQGKSVKNAGWDFSIGGSQGTGTFRSVSRPPHSPANPVNQRKASESGYQGASSFRSRLTESSETASGKDVRVPYHDEHKGNHLDDVIDEYYVFLFIFIGQVY